MKSNTGNSIYILILGVSFVLVTTQGISYNYFKYSAEGSNSGNGIGISPPDINIGTDDNNKSVSSLPDILGGGDSESSNETDNGLTGDLLSSETNSESSNETDNGDSDDSGSSESTDETSDTEDQTNNLDININNIEIKQRLDLKISEDEGEAPIPKVEQDRIESQDKVVVTERKGLTGPDCRTGNVLAGASNAEDLRVLTECQDAIGTVMHTKNMDDGDYKFFLKLDPQFAFLVNEKNNDETEGFLVVEIVPPDRNVQGMYLPKDGDRVHVWGAWVTDKPKGWHEIHPTWKVVKQ